MTIPNGQYLFCLGICRGQVLFFYRATKPISVSPPLGDTATPGTSVASIVALRIVAAGSRNRLTGIRVREQVCILLMLLIRHIGVPDELGKHARSKLGEAHMAAGPGMFVEIVEDRFLPDSRRKN